jgi:D-sedoheptulose 7-phosphate isomerase
MLGVTSYIDRYLSEARTLLDALDRNALKSAIDHIRHLRDRNGRMFIVGVGGSAANASHAVNDFRKIAGIESYAPTDNVAELTAWINDESWDRSIERWLRGSRLSSNDALMVLSVGGGSDHTSVNLVKAAEYAKEVGADLIAVVGRDGGLTGRLADVTIHIPPQSDDTITPLTESFQAIVWHLMVTALNEETAQ